MTTFNELAARSEFFPKNKIVPQRILKGPRWIKSRVRFMKDMYAISGENGYVVFYPNVLQNSDCMVLIYTKGMKNANKLCFQGSPYHKTGQTHWMAMKETESKDEFALRVLEYLG